MGQQFAALNAAGRRKPSLCESTTNIERVANASITARRWISASLPVPVPVPRKRHLLIPVAYHRHYGRAVWIDPVVLRAITISRNNIIIPVRPYDGHRDVNRSGSGLPRMGCSRRGQNRRCKGQYDN